MASTSSSARSRNAATPTRVLTVALRSGKRSLRGLRSIGARVYQKLAAMAHAAVYVVALFCPLDRSFFLTSPSFRTRGISFASMPKVARISSARRPPKALLVFLHEGDDAIQRFRDVFGRTPGQTPRTCHSRRFRAVARSSRWDWDCLGASRSSPRCTAGFAQQFVQRCALDGVENGRGEGGGEILETGAER